MTQNSKFKIQNSRSGQSLVEIMIGLGIGAVLIGAASIAVAFMLRSSTASQNFQKGGQLASDLMDKASSWSSANWQNIYGLTKGLSTQYFLYASGTALFAVQGQEGMLDNDVTNGLVGEWKFDEDPTTTSTTTYDTTGNNNNGTLINSPTRASSTCEISNCLNFNSSSSQYVNLGSPANGSLDFGTSSFSVGIWLNGGPQTSNTIPLGKGNENCLTSGYRYIANSGGSGSMQLVLALSDGTGSIGCGNTQYSPSITVFDNHWHDVFVTINRSLNTMTIYLDGVSQGSTNITITGSTSSGSPFTIGRNSSSAGGYFTGSIDDVRIYNRSLSATEIQNLYKSAVFTRYFSVENVCRTNDASSSIAGTAPCGGSTVNDPSTQKLSVYASWLPNNTGSPQIKITNYLTRWQNQAFVQADWSGGAGQDGPFTSPGSIYSTSTNIDIRSSPGSIKILNLTPP